LEKFFKRLTAAVMTVAMLATSVLFLSAFAASAHDVPQTVPLRSTLESIGAQVDWTRTQTTVSLNDDVFVFTPGSLQARLNSEEITLSHPVIITNSIAVMSADDAALISALVQSPPIDTSPEVPVGEFAQTIQTAQIAAQQAAEVGVAGLSIALVDAETGFTWTHGFGMADTNRNLPVNADTMFQIGSVSKQFTAIAVMQLVEQGLVDLDAPLVRYIPEFSILPSARYGGNSDNITVRMLLNNTSGVPSNWMRAFYVTGSEHYQGAMNDLLDWLKTRELSFVPGTRYEYANNNWVLAGILVARVTGHTNYFEGFVEYTDENIFAPLGMTRSTFEFTPDLTNVAMAHIMTGMQDDMFLVSKISAGSILSSANDMAQYMHFMLGGEADAQILSRASIAQMLRVQTNHVEMSGAQLGYGLGFAQIQLPDGFQYVGHSGGTLHFHTDLILDPNAGLGVFVATNSTTGALAAQAISVAVIQSALEEKTGSIPRVPVDGPQMDPDATPVELSEDEISELYVLEGAYDFGIGGIWELHIEDGALVWTPLYGGEAEVAVPMSDGTFQGPVGRYLFNVDGDDISVTYMSPIFGIMPGARITISDDTQAPEGFSSWVGQYDFVPVLGNDITISDYIVIAIDEFGRPTITQHVAMLDVLSEVLGINMVTSNILTLIDGTWYLGLTPILFSMDNGVATIDFMGATFARS